MLTLLRGDLVGLRQNGASLVSDVRNPHSVNLLQIGGFADERYRDVD